MAEREHDNVPAQYPHEAGVIAYPSDPNQQQLGLSDAPSMSKPILSHDEKQGFLKKVYGIVTCQLLVSFVLCYLCEA